MTSLRLLLEGVPKWSSHAIIMEASAGSDPADPLRSVEGAGLSRLEGRAFSAAPCAPRGQEARTVPPRGQM
jgi:hypothetical protein